MYYDYCILLFSWLTKFNEGANIWHLSQCSIRPSIYFSSIAKSRRICSGNQPVLSKKGKVSCSRKQQGLSWGSNPRPPHYESDVQPTAPRRPLTKSGMGHLIVIAYVVIANSNVVMTSACPQFNTILHIVRRLSDNFSVKSNLQFKMFHRWTVVTSYSQGSVRRLMDHN